MQESDPADPADLNTTGYLRHHELTFPNKTQLLKSVDTYMTAFAAKEAARDKLRARQRQEPDEDGFITVTRGGRINPARQEIAKELAERQNEKRKGLDDFYRFQSREKMKAKAGELKKKFEEDKEKVRKLKENKGRFRVSSNKAIDRSDFNANLFRSLNERLLLKVSWKSGLSSSW